MVDRQETSRWSWLKHPLIVAALIGGCSFGIYVLGLKEGVKDWIHPEDLIEDASTLESGVEEVCARLAHGYILKQSPSYGDLHEVYQVLTDPGFEERLKRTARSDQYRAMEELALVMDRVINHYRTRFSMFRRSQPEDPLAYAERYNAAFAPTLSLAERELLDRLLQTCRRIRTCLRPGRT